MSDNLVDAQSKIIDYFNILRSVQKTSRSEEFYRVFRTASPEDKIEMLTLLSSDSIQDKLEFNVRIKQGRSRKYVRQLAKEKGIKYIDLKSKEQLLEEIHGHMPEETINKPTSRDY
jgi:hypothetical protein